MGQFGSPLPNKSTTGLIFYKAASGNRLRQLSESLLS
jgi:hypothetical protein